MVNGCFLQVAATRRHLFSFLTALLLPLFSATAQNAGPHLETRDGVTRLIVSGEPYLQVQDTGMGIAESELSKIFDRFYRSDEVRASAGTGLGLSIAKWIVDKHGGHFEILSRQALGTRIRIVLA